jgi:hypothetical protein
MAYAYVVAGLFWLAMGIFKRLVSVSLAKTPQNEVFLFVKII